MSKSEQEESKRQRGWELIGRVNDIFGFILWLRELRDLRDVEKNLRRIRERLDRWGGIEGLGNKLRELKRWIGLDVLHEMPSRDELLHLELNYHRNQARKLHERIVTRATIVSDSEHEPIWAAQEGEMALLVLRFLYHVGKMDEDYADLFPDSEPLEELVTQFYVFRKRWADS